MTEKQRRDRLIEWLKVIQTDVQDLLLADHIFWELQTIVGNNPKFQKSSGFFPRWIASAFVQATAVGVRRQAKTGDDTVSLRRFLGEIQKYPSLISRSHYMSLLENSEPWLKEISERDFDRFAGEGATQIPESVATRQIQDLTQAVNAIEHYVDRRVAHYDRRGLNQGIPTFSDLSESIRFLEKTVILYWRLLTGASMTTLLPTLQFDWTDVFEFAWQPRRNRRRDSTVPEGG